IESNDIPDELIYHFNTTNSIIKNDSQNIISFTRFTENPTIICNTDNPHYFSYAYGYKSIISNYEYYNNDTHVSVACKNNIQCFSNKCVNNTCTSNIEANIERCDTLYTEKTIEKYLHCGHMLHEYCTENIECSFNNCSYNKCSDIHYIPSESDTVVIDFQDICLMIGFILNMHLVPKIVGKYFELDNILPKEGYLFSLDDCSKTDEGFWGINDNVYGCYRSESVNGKFGPSTRVDPDQYQFKDDGKEQTINDNALINPITVRYYDIVFNNNYRRALTEYGWCNFTYVIECELHWMLNLSDTIRINQINIPGTHDSVTYSIQFYSCKYLLSDVFDEATEFLYKNPSETVIIHLKNEAITYYNKDDNINIIISVDEAKTHFGENDYYQTIANLSINNNNSEKYGQLYSSFFYIGDDTFPTLADARGVTDMVACEKEIWLGETGITVNEMDEKSIEKKNNVQNKREVCYPGMFTVNNTNILLQGDL
ncbi:hypothetical protein PIROE2DRAFT_19011, partial [Piromyces sp. E2]